MEESTSDSDRLIPLNKLMDVPRGRKFVDIEPRLLERLDFSKLKHTLEFDLRGQMNVGVKVKQVSDGDRLEAEVTISFDSTAWPDPSWRFMRLFYSVVDLAANLTIEQEEAQKAVRPYAPWQDTPIVVKYYFPISIRGNDLIAALSDKVERIRTEIPTFLNIIAQGPHPGMTTFDEYGSPRRATTAGPRNEEQQ